MLEYVSSMPQSALVIDPVFLKHDPGSFHPERPERLRILLELAQQAEKTGFALLPPRPASSEEVALCHDPHYIDFVRSTSDKDLFALDGDTITCRDSFGVAMLAVGGYLRLLDALAAADYQNGFALVRPPGHHALRERAMGFCLFNTVAIGAKHVIATHGAKRVVIVDWDVHHGNGTQAAFYDDPSVLFISAHQYPYYPGTGAAREVGTGRGEGFTVNIPVPAGCDDGDYLGVFRDVVVPITRRFQPDWVLVSAGFDCHRDDPLGGMEVTEEGFGGMSAMLAQLAREHTNGKIAFLLEGGYNLHALKQSVAAVLQVLKGRDLYDQPSKASGERIRARLRQVLELHEKSLG